VNGEDGTQRGAPSVATADNADDEEDDDNDDEAVIGGRSLYESGQLDPSEHEKDSLHKSMFRKYMDVVDTLPLNESDRSGMSVKDMGERYDVWNRAKLRTGDLRRLINQTLSQSVPANVVTVVNSYTKMFAGMLIEEAREVQAEWMAMEAERADGEGNPAFKRLRRTYEPEDGPEVDGDETTRPNTREGNNKANGVKNEESSSPANPNSTLTDTVMNETQNDSTQPHDESTTPLYPGGAGGLSTSISECDRGPLLPDHLREALRRYRRARKGGTVGFTGMSLEGREVAASRMGGRRLFR
jgi:transcription initiation factor TFIID subunit 11